MVVRVRRILHGRPGVDHLRLPVSGHADRNHANPVSAIRIGIVGQHLDPRLPVLGHAQRVVRGYGVLVDIDHLHHDLRLRFAAQRVRRRHGQRVAVRIGFEVLSGADVAQIPRRRIDGEAVGARRQLELELVSIRIGRANPAQPSWRPAAVAVLRNLETGRPPEHRRAVHDFDLDLRGRGSALPVVDLNPDDDAADSVRCRPEHIRPVGRARERSLRGAPVVCDGVAVRIRGVGRQPHLAAARNRAGIAGRLHSGRTVRRRRGVVVPDRHLDRRRVARRHLRRQRPQRHREGLLVRVGVLHRGDRARAGRPATADRDARQRSEVPRFGGSRPQRQRDRHAVRQRLRQPRRHRYRLPLLHGIRRSRQAHPRRQRAPRHRPGSSPRPTPGCPPSPLPADCPAPP